MSAQLKTNLVVQGGGQTMIEKRMFNFKFTVMREPDLQRIKLFPGFKLLKIFENFKTTFGYYLSNFLCPYLISGQCFNVFFLY